MKHHHEFDNPRDWPAFKFEQLYRWCVQEDRKDQGYKFIMDNPSEAKQVELLAEEMKEQDLERRALRRHFEDKMADQFDALAKCHDLVTGEQAEHLANKAEEMRACRRSGALGARPDGGGIIAWDFKCTCSRCCPDAAREESQRLAQIYTTQIMLWAAERANHRLFYVVATEPNYPRGQLKEGKRLQFENLREFFKKGIHPDLVGGPFSLVRQIKHRGQLRYIKEDRQGESFAPAWPNIKGAMAVQEDPMSARADWNIHTNLILCVKGRFDYQHLRSTWGQNIEIRELDKKDRDALRRTLLEVIKYSAAHVGMKSHEKAEEGGSAPGMLEWDLESLKEWYFAQSKFRRTRSYGCLYGVDGKRWNGSSPETRAGWCRAAEVADHRHRLWARDQEQPEHQHKAWVRDRTKIKKVMNQEERMDVDAIEWVGCVGYERGHYEVFLSRASNAVASIQEDNFSSNSGSRGTKPPPVPPPPPRNQGSFQI